MTNAHDRAIWHTLMDQEHPRGTTTFARAQLRYLFLSAHGLLGATIWKQHGIPLVAMVLRLDAVRVG